MRVEDLYRAYVETLRTRTNYLALFDRYDTRMEGWFQAEFLNLLARLPEASVEVQGVNKSAPDGFRPDFSLRIESNPVRIEMKSLVQGRRSLGAYFRSSWGRDLGKIRCARAGEIALITIVIPLPSRSGWEYFRNEARRRYLAEPVAEEDVNYGDGAARATLWMKSHRSLG